MLIDENREMRLIYVLIRADELRWFNVCNNLDMAKNDYFITY